MIFVQKGEILDVDEEDLTGDSTWGVDTKAGDCQTQPPASTERKEKQKQVDLPHDEMTRRNRLWIRVIEVLFEIDDYDDDDDDDDDPTKPTEPTGPEPETDSTKTTKRRAPKSTSQSAEKPIAHFSPSALQFRMLETLPPL